MERAVVGGKKVICIIERSLVEAWLRAVVGGKRVNHRVERPLVEGWGGQ